MYEDVEQVRALLPNEIDKMKNAQLKQALSTLLNTQVQVNDEPSNSVILDELRSLKGAVKEMAGLKQKVDSLSSKLDDAYKIIHQQQLFLESLDGKERRRNLIMMGVSEEPDDAGSTDMDKIQHVLAAARYEGTVEPTRCSAAGQGKPYAISSATAARRMAGRNCDVSIRIHRICGRDNDVMRLFCGFVRFSYSCFGWCVNVP